MPRVQDTTINTNNWTVEKCERDSSDKGNQIDEMSEWEILKAMEDEGISVWKNWCKFQDTSSTVDPRKIILFIDSYVLPRENAFLQKIKTDAKSHQANGDATPVSMIETLVRPVMRLWSHQNKKEKYTKRSSHPDFISDSSPEGEHGKDDGVEQDKDSTFIEARVNPSSKSRGRDTTLHERNSVRLEKRPKPDRPGLSRNDRLSVASMNEQFGTSWRQEEEAEYYDKGVKLVSEFHDAARGHSRLTVVLDLTHLQFNLHLRIQPCQRVYQVHLYRVARDQDWINKQMQNTPLNEMCGGIIINSLSAVNRTTVPIAFVDPANVLQK
ncbi:hypothetical protein BGZ49_001314 [Haplosporangium sp. Z 27]|nr:hypothetical protein BGZ49_001314 [Haplosporangium sp. Z 27]